jgi:hypothetical protein
MAPTTELRLVAAACMFMLQTPAFARRIKLLVVEPFQRSMSQAASLFNVIATSIAPWIDMVMGHIVLARLEVMSLELQEVPPCTL